MGAGGGEGVGQSALRWEAPQGALKTPADYDMETRKGEGKEEGTRTLQVWAAHSFGDSSVF